MLEYQEPQFDFSAPLKYAKRSGDAEPQNQKYRTDFMRDRDRILYCGAFRRLSGKTQIYLAGKNDHQRNRLTHTLEVSQIARTISQALKLNCDLTEAIALGHDLGHTPFGHAGEQLLHEIMVPNNHINIKNSPMNDIKLSSSSAIKEPVFGFKHNIQSVRVAANLESNYGGGGLNLTNYTLWGIMHHSSLQYKRERVNTETLDPSYRLQYEDLFKLPDSAKEAWSFEAFVVRQADEIAQWHHDLEDALRGNAMTSSEVCNTISDNLSAIMSDQDKRNLDELKGKNQINKKYITDLARIVVNTLVNRIIECSLHNLQLLKDEYGKRKKNPQFFIEHDWKEADILNAISFKEKGEDDSRIASFQKDYPSVISEMIHHSREVERMNAKGQYIIKKLFQAYYSHPQQLPDNIIIQYMVDMGRYKDLADASQVGTGKVRTEFDQLLSDGSSFSIEQKIGLMRKICDHIAGMTDHYAIEEFENLYN